MRQLLILTILVATSSWPVWGWDGVWTVDKKYGYLTQILADADGNTVMLECKDGVPCDWTIAAKNLFTCHQRMREAMAWMAPLNRSYNENKKRDPNFDFERQYREYPKNAEKWDRTVKDCVEGK